MGSRQKIFLIVVLLFGGMGGSVSGCGPESQATHAPVSTADVEDLGARLEAPRQRALLMVFWATWCDPCVAEIPDLVELYEQQDESLEILAVSLDSFLKGSEAGVEVVETFLEATPTPYENVVYVGGQDELFEKFRLPGGIPYAILFDQSGEVIRRFPGRVVISDLMEAIN